MLDYFRHRRWSHVDFASPRITDNLATSTFRTTPHDADASVSTSASTSTPPSTSTPVSASTSTNYIPNTSSSTTSSDPAANPGANTSPSSLPSKPLPKATTIITNTTAVGSNPGTITTIIITATTTHPLTAATSTSTSTTCPIITRHIKTTILPRIATDPIPTATTSATATSFLSSRVTSPSVATRPAITTALSPATHSIGTDTCPATSLSPASKSPAPHPATTVPHSASIFSSPASVLTPGVTETRLSSSATRSPSVTTGGITIGPGITAPRSFTAATPNGTRSTPVTAASTPTATPTRLPSYPSTFFRPNNTNISLTTKYHSTTTNNSHPGVTVTLPDTATTPPGTTTTRCDTKTVPGPACEAAVGSPLTIPVRQSTADTPVKTASRPWTSIICQGTPAGRRTTGTCGSVTTVCQAALMPPVTTTSSQIAGTARTYPADATYLSSSSVANCRYNYYELRCHCHWSSDFRMPEDPCHDSSSFRVPECHERMLSYLSSYLCVSPGECRGDSACYTHKCHKYVFAHHNCMP
ncbi:uncharacterized protein [Penaeus vannamei]|uniref:uncharacterized protein n=1 Tax=Penaeus vannamei TaxID=6689 RepID=UPI00387F9131